MACVSEAVTGSVANVMLDLRCEVGATVSRDETTTSHYMPNPSTYLVSSIGSATSSTHGCLSRLRNAASFLRTARTLSSLAGSTAPLRAPGGLRLALSHVQIDTCFPFELCTARSTFQIPIWVGPAWAELELAGWELGEDWTVCEGWAGQRGDAHSLMG